MKKTVKRRHIQKGQFMTTIKFCMTTNSTINITKQKIQNYIQNNPK